MDSNQQRAEVKGHTLIFPLLALSCHHCPTELPSALSEDQDEILPHGISLGHMFTHLAKGSSHTGVGA